MSTNNDIRMITILRTSTNNDVRTQTHLYVIVFSRHPTSHISINSIIFNTPPRTELVEDGTLKPSVPLSRLDTRLQFRNLSRRELLQIHTHGNKQNTQSFTNTLTRAGETPRSRHYIRSTHIGTDIIDFRRYIFPRQMEHVSLSWFAIIPRKLCRSD